MGLALFESMNWIPLVADSGVWTAEYKIPGFFCRSYAFRLKDGGFMVMSPGDSVMASFAQELGEQQELRFIVAPNIFHWLGIPSWQEAHPHARVVCGEGARKKLTKKGLSVRSTIAELQEALPDHITLIEVPGTRISELWIRVETSEGTAWMIGDAFFNMKKIGKKPHHRIIATLAKSGPGLAISGLMKWGGIKNRRVYRDWVSGQLDDHKPSIFVPMHGTIRRDASVGDDLKKIVAERLY